MAGIMWWSTHPEARRVDETWVEIGEERIHISTVFLPFDHAFRLFGGDEKPVLFETMIFGGPCDGFCDNYETYDDALLGHQLAVKLAKESQSANLEVCPEKNTSQTQSE